ncbi:MAG: GNAT family N-acetyltransferase [Alphaproteobacteria bacterium]|nr:GNAT family N-acetyltransferase [Alphaproteobacteria bacterium]
MAFWQGICKEKIMHLKIEHEDNPDSSAISAIQKGLDAYNIAIAGEYNTRPLWLFGRDEASVIQAGLKGQTHYSWLYVDWLWIAESFRGHDYGSKLLLQAENIAKERGCVGAFLYTYRFQAPDFYQKYGYKEFGRVENLPPGHSRIYFSKTF